MYIPKLENLHCCFQSMRHLLRIDGKSPRPSKYLLALNPYVPNNGPSNLILINFILYYLR